MMNNMVGTVECIPIFNKIEKSYICKALNIRLLVYLSRLQVT